MDAAIKSIRPAKNNEPKVVETRVVETRPAELDHAVFGVELAILIAVENERAGAEHTDGAVEQRCDQPGPDEQRGAMRRRPTEQAVAEPERRKTGETTKVSLLLSKPSPRSSAGKSAVGS